LATRPELNTEAAELGIPEPEKLPNKQAVIDAIDEAADPDARSLDADLFATARVVSVFGPFASRTLIEISSDLARRLFDDEPLSEVGRSNVIDATEQDIELIRAIDPDAADSSTAATALRMAYELDHPFNSATSKAQCAKAHAECMGRLWERVPEKPKEDEVARIKAQRGSRRATS
jgi:hypothetical protein